MDMTCHRCGESVAPGTPLYSDHVRLPDGTVRCADCARTERAHGPAVVEEQDDPIMIVNTNLPMTH